MLKYFFQGLISNLKPWIEIEENSLFQKYYIDYYNMLEKKMDKL